jgi:hypothetical protein
MIETNASPFRSRHNIAATERAVKDILKDGTPRWVSHPQDFKQWAAEVYHQEKEESDKLALGFREEEQDTLTDVKARRVKPMDSRAFIQKLRDNGIKCFTYQIPHTPNTPGMMVNTVGLWCVVPGEEQIGFKYQGHRYQYMTWMAIPMMWEWSLLPVDEHQIPVGENRGWRTVVARLIARKVLTEIKAHEIFGEPSGATSKIYKRTLFEFRNGRYKPNDRPITAE